jgi:tetratricopeptide (TPR) repeat protein
MRLSILVLVFVSGLPAWGQWSDDAERCANISGPDQRLPYCSAAIESGKLSTSNLAITFSNRGLLYQDKGSYDRAIQDYDQAIRLNPSDADVTAAWCTRGLGHHFSGRIERIHLNA